MKEINEAMFKTKADNIFVKIHTAIMRGDIEPVKHFISEELAIKLESLVNDLNAKSYRQMYDELNVKSTTIKEISEDDSYYVIKVLIVSRYMDYIIDLNTGNIVKGNDQSRVMKNNILTFKRNKDVKETKIVRKCPGCGASINVNNNGVCEYCGAIYNLDDYDFILIDMETY